MNDSELLQYIRKLIEEKSETLQGRTAWQEHLDRHTTVSAKSIQASEIIRGFSGSWASIYSAFPSDERLEKIADQRTPPNPSREYSKIGQSGVPEINFAPYDHHTNRQGMKGTSLIGHPISFEIVGTTTKSAHCDWQWFAIDNSSSSTTGDVLKIDDESSLLNPTAPTTPNATTVSDGYGLGISSSNGENLYLVISHTGEPPPSIDGTNHCGLGDGFIAQEGVAPTLDPTKPRQAVKAKSPHSKFEIFRVKEIERFVTLLTGKITLEPNKRLKDYFTFDPTKTNIIRSITLIRAKATQLATIPNSASGAGKERAFVVVPPEKNSRSDLYPPYTKWASGGFDPVDPTLTGIPTRTDYSELNNLPIPRVLGKYTAQLEKESQGLSKTALVSRLFGNFSSEIKVGQLVHIFKKEIDRVIDLPLTADPFGWYEIIENEQTVLKIRKVVEVNPSTGEKNYRPIMVLDNADPTFNGLTYTVHFHLHDPISALHTNHFDIDALEHARLDNLIDPSWVSESGKSQESGQNTLYSKADRAVFNTAHDGYGDGAADPGSLLDLGFRMVLYPALAYGGVDWKRPITSREAIIDPTIENEDQYIHIDYSNGLVLLSHEPKWEDDNGNPLENDINPNGFTDSFGRVRLYACCVPYSRELGQLGSSIRVTASTLDTPNDLEEQNDIYGKRIAFDIYQGFSVISQTINSVVVLKDLDSENLLPESGYVEILHSAETVGLSNQPAFTVVDGDGVTRRVSTFFYAQKEIVNVDGADRTALLLMYGGGATGDSITTSFTGEYKIVLRKNVRALCDDKGVCGVPYQEDTTHGSAKRFSTIRFKNSDIIQNKDGSVTIDVGVESIPEEIVEEPIPLSGEFVLLPKGPTSGNGHGESRYFGGWSDTTVLTSNDYPTDTPLYEFSGGYGRGFLRKGYPIKPSGYFNIKDTIGWTTTPPSDFPYLVDQTFNTGYSITEDLPINSGVCSGNLSVGYRHINSRESSLYSSQHRQMTIANSAHKGSYYGASMRRQMRVLDGMVIEDVTNGTFYPVGSKGTFTTVGITRHLTLTLNTSATPITDGDTIYIAETPTTKIVEFVFRNVSNPAIPEEVLIGPDVYQSMCNLVLVAMNHPSRQFSFDLETYKDELVLHIYSNKIESAIGPTVTTGFGNVYDHPTDFTGYNNVGGSIVGENGASTAPLISRQQFSFATYSDTAIKAESLGSVQTPNYLISSGDRASIFWTFYDPTTTNNLDNTKEKIVLGFLGDDFSTRYQIDISFTNGATLYQSLENVCYAINSKTNADYVSAGFPADLEYAVEARICHIEEGTTHNRYALEIRYEKIGNVGNRWYIGSGSNLGSQNTILSLITPYFTSDLLDASGTFWTTYATPNGGTFLTHNFNGGGQGKFFYGGLEQEISYDVNDHLETELLPNMSGLGDRTDNDIARKPLAGHHYRIVPNVEFVPVLGYKGVHGGLLPPYTDQSDPTTIIADAHAIFFDTRYVFNATDVGKKFYLCGTDIYAYVGWWEILGIIPNYTIPHNVEENDPMTVAIVRKIGVETRSSTPYEREYGQFCMTDKDQLPLTYRSPKVRMGYDVVSNGQGGMDNFEPYGFFKFWDKVNPADASYTDLAVTIQLAINGSEAKVQQVVISKQDLATGKLFGASADPNYVVYDAVSLANFCNADQRTNGSRFRFSDGTTGVAFITWIVETDSEYKHGNALYATYSLAPLTQTQKDSVLGADGLLQINFLSRQDGLFFKDDLITYGPPIGLNDPSAIGFISYPGHNAEFDTCLGDRNSAFVIHPFEIIDAASNPFGVPAPVLNRRSGSACEGLRWVISEPLTDRHSGSYVHISKENDFTFNGVNFQYQQGATLGERPILNYQDTYRINKCPSTQQFLLGGDVEVFHTELNKIRAEDGLDYTHHPIAYSSLSTMGTWNDTMTNTLPTSGRNYSPTYKLQLVNKEKIVTISPTSMASNSIFGTQVGSEETGVGGLGTKIINLVVPQMTLSAETPFKLFSKSNIFRSNLWGTGTGAITSPDDTRSEREIWNSDNIFGNDLMRDPREIPYYYYSMYSWSPNNSWWQVQMPYIPENDQYDASTPPPTLRVDLTEQFTQSLVNGNTDPKGVRLNKLWVNFGVWGDYLDAYFNDKRYAIPSFPFDIVDSTLALSKPDPGRSAVSSRNHIAFNLVLELPVAQATKPNKNKNRGIIHIVNTVPSANLNQALLQVSYNGTNYQLRAVSINDATGTAIVPSELDVIVGEYIFDSGTSTWVWTPLTTYQLARVISDGLNLLHKNGSITPSASDVEISAHALYDKIYYETPTAETRLLTFATTTALKQENFRTYNVWKDTGTVSSGSDNLLFGDRSGTATPSHLMDTDNLDPIKTIVVPLYVNRDAGELMPNTMEQQVDMGVGRYNASGENISADWNNGDPNYGFGYSDYPYYSPLNSLPTTETVTKSPYQLPVTHSHPTSKNSLIGNPITPMLWGGIDFDSANNNFIQDTNETWNVKALASALSAGNDTYNGHSGKSTAPFSFGTNALVQGSQYPRLSRMGGGLRADFTDGNVVNGDIFARTAVNYPFEGPASLSSGAMTGIVIAHKAIFPGPTIQTEGDTISGTPTIGTDPIRARNARSCSHSFTVALTPMAQKFDYPTDPKGVRSSVGYLFGVPTNAHISERLSDFGRYLDPTNDQNQVGNWLGEILQWAGSTNTDGSTLPQGARVYLEISTNQGVAYSNNGVWVGSVKCSFDVETTYGTTQNKLIEE